MRWHDTHTRKRSTAFLRTHSTRCRQAYVVLEGKYRVAGDKRLNMQQNIRHPVLARQNKEQQDNRTKRQTSTAWGVRTVLSKLGMHSRETCKDTQYTHEKATHCTPRRSWGMRTLLGRLAVLPQGRAEVDGLSRLGLDAQRILKRRAYHLGAKV